MLQSWSGIENDAPSGTGVKGDTKDLGGDGLSGGVALSTKPVSQWKLVSATDRFETFNANHSSSSTYPTTPMVDADGDWSEAPNRAATDAQYYAALTDNFYRTEMGFDLVSCLGHPIRSVVHYSQGYANAFWDPVAEEMVYGDGDGSTLSQMSGAQDVVSHELTHAVTGCRAPLDYVKDSGALNEAFSDIMGTTAEFELEEPNSSNCRRAVGQTACADWWLGEDLVIGGPDYAIRNLADPGVLGQPSHYSQRSYANTKPSNCTSWTDYCGVHTNSGIANHAFYLMSNGGRNARCAGANDSQADCDVLVSGVGVGHAGQVFFRAWSMLTNDATFCEARTATIEAADLLIDADPGTYTQADHAAAELAWDAVGVYCAAPFSYHVTPASRTVAAMPGGSTDLPISVVRTTTNQPISFSVSDPTPATATFSPNPETTSDASTTLHLDVAGDAPVGIYPMTVTASDGGDPQTFSFVLVVDNDAPTAQVNSVSLGLGDTIATDGHVPLHVSWSTADATSGVASGAVSVDSAPLATGVSGSAAYASLDNTHDFVASATDLAGNTAASDPLSVTQTSVHGNSRERQLHEVVVNVQRVDTVGQHALFQDPRRDCDGHLHRHGHLLGVDARAEAGQGQGVHRRDAHREGRPLLVDSDAAQGCVRGTRPRGRLTHAQDLPPRYFGPAARRHRRLRRPEPLADRDQSEVDLVKLGGSLAGKESAEASSTGSSVVSVWLAGSSGSGCSFSGCWSAPGLSFALSRFSMTAW